MAGKTNKYTLSLTGAGTYQQEMLLAAQAFLDIGDWTDVRRLIENENLLVLNTVGNSKRIGSEVIKRLKTLSPEELEFFVTSRGDDLSALTWVAFCRTYPIVRAFSEELVSGRFERMISDVSKEAYEAFAEEQADLHPEFSSLTESSRDKVKIRIFGMARDCNLLDREGNITPLYLSPALVRVLSESDPEDLAVFPKVGTLR